MTFAASGEGAAELGPSFFRKLSFHVRRPPWRGIVIVTARDQLGPFFL